MTLETREAWERWIIGGLLTTCLALGVFVWHEQDGRLRSLEDWRGEHMELERQQSNQLATVTANQVQVMRQLELNGAKLDQLLVNQSWPGR